MFTNNENILALKYQKAQSNNKNPFNETNTVEPSQNTLTSFTISNINNLMKPRILKVKQVISTTLKRKLKNLKKRN